MEKEETFEGVRLKITRVYQQDLKVVDQFDQSALGYIFEVDFTSGRCGRITELFLKVRFNVDEVREYPRIKSMFPYKLNNNRIKARQTEDQTIAYPVNFKDDVLHRKGDCTSSLGIDTQEATWKLKLEKPKNFRTPACFSLVVYVRPDTRDSFSMGIEAKATSISEGQRFFFQGKHKVGPMDWTLTVEELKELIWPNEWKAAGEPASWLRTKDVGQNWQ
ncbi:hypothetical protein BT69DRAFT_1276308 [Atractiella rhizophila]|nr:hypothetical protein BT69DRAFT_1276308 [Atractiella rhizophila]